MLDAIADNKAVICRLKVRNVEDTYVDLIPINTSLESGVIEFASVPTSDGQYVLKLTPETDYLSVGISKVTSEPPYQVGDILTTLRTDLDDTWLLCNGQAVANSEIDSRLYECTSPSSINGGSVVFNHACAHSVRTNKLCSMNGYLVMIANDYDGTDYLAQIAYTTDPAQGWTTKCIAKSNSNTCAITGIASSGAQWAVCLLDGSIYYATTPDGAWSKGATDGVSRSLYCITYDGEFWMVGGAESTKAVAARFTNLSASPSFVTIWNNATSAGAITCIERHNGVFICGGLYHERKDDNTQIYAPRVACGSSLSTMNQKNLVEYSSAPTVRDVVRGISYHNG